MMTSSTITKSQRKSVTFASTATMRLSLHVNDYTDEEFDSCFFSPEDYQSFKQDIKRTVHIMESLNKRKRKTTSNVDVNAQLSSLSLCTRGIEKRTKQALQIRYKHIQTTKLAVLGEQIRQRHEQTTANREEKIATLYTKYAESSASAAYSVGLLDQLASKEQYQQPKNVHHDTNLRTTQNVACQFMKLRRIYGEKPNVGTRREIFNSAA